MSAYENVVAGKLRVKGKALNVRNGSMKKKKKQKVQYVPFSGNGMQYQLTGGDNSPVEMQDEREHDEDERLTPAERRYVERWQKIELQRLAKDAKKSHRDRIQEFNQYLANLSEHYDIPKVGPG